MENAAKALLIAAGIMFAMMIISLIAYMSSSITEMGEAQESKRAAEQLAAFNAEYEAYNKQLMYGTDIVTVINKAQEDGITIVVNETTITEASFTIGAVRENIRNAKLDRDDPNFEGLRIFRCEGIEYDTATGKVSRMEFTERPTE